MFATLEFVIASFMFAAILVSVALNMKLLNYSQDFVVTHTFILRRAFHSSQLYSQMQHWRYYWLLSIFFIVICKYCTYGAIMYYSCVKWPWSLSFIIFIIFDVISCGWIQTFLKRDWIHFYWKCLVCASPNFVFYCIELFYYCFACATYDPVSSVILLVQPFLFLLLSVWRAPEIHNMFNTANIPDTYDAKISYLLTHKFGKNISNLIWIVYLNQTKSVGEFDGDTNAKTNENHIVEMIGIQQDNTKQIQHQTNDLDPKEKQYWKIIKQMDILIRLYHKHKNAEYDYYSSFWHFVDFKMNHKCYPFEFINLQQELEHDAKYQDHLYLHFSEYFAGKRDVFLILKLCYSFTQPKAINRYYEVERRYYGKDMSRYYDEERSGSTAVQEFHKFLSQNLFLHESTQKIHQMDVALRLYYKQNNALRFYYDLYKIGKFTKLLALKLLNIDLEKTFAANATFDKSLHLLKDISEDLEANTYKKSTAEIQREMFTVLQAAYHFDLNKNELQWEDIIHKIHQIYFDESHKNGVQRMAAAYHLYKSSNKLLEWIALNPNYIHLLSSNAPFQEYMPYISAEDEFLWLQDTYHCNHFVQESVMKQERKGTNILTWFGVLNIIHQHFDPIWSIKLRNKKDMMHRIHSLHELNQLQHHKSLSIPDVQWKYLLNIIETYKNPYSKQQSMIFMNMKTDTELEYIRDIYSVHKLFREENNKTSMFTASDFYEILKKNDAVTITETFLRFYLDKYYPTLTIPPNYVINDDLFEILKYIVSVTYLVNAIRDEDEWKYSDKQQNVNLFIIPKRVEKVIDPDSVFKYKIDQIQKFQKVMKVLTIEEDRISIYNKLRKQLDVNTMTYTNIVVDRRHNKTNNAYNTIYFYQTNDVNEQKHLFHIYYITYFLIFNFHINSKQNVVKTYMNYGINEQIRFFPHFIMDVLPKLFKKPKYKKATKYFTDFISPMYQNNFKNSWSVHLYDSKFNQKYKQLTGYDHIDINYDREKTLFVKTTNDENYHYSSDITIATSHACNINTDLEKCQHCKYLVKILMSTQMNKNASIINKNHYGKIALSFDHLIRSHHLFKKQQLTKVQQYFTSNCGGFCIDGDDCNIVNQHKLTKRESINGATDSVLDYLVNNNPNIDKNQLQFFKEWICENEYDSDAIRCDIIDAIQSNILNCLQERKMDFNWFKCIQKHMDIASDKNDTTAELLARLYNAIHVYLLHEHHDLYRIRNGTNRFESKVDKKKESIVDALFSYLYLRDKNEADKFKQWMNKSGLYDETKIRDDISDEQMSLIKRYFEHLKVTHTINFHHIRQFMTMNEDAKQINFGDSILNWLQYGETPTFNSLPDEIMNNPSSTVTTSQYKRFEEACKVKYDSLLNIERYTLKELIAIKIYCDTTEYQALLRRAFWKSNTSENKQMKLNFYRWASKLYETFLYAAKPPPRHASHHSTPCTLYHGLNQLFVIDTDLPRYNGIFSTSTSESTAHSFSEGNGLLWSINGSYTNRFSFIKGINVQWISCHPNEFEFTLFNQHIPIKSTFHFTKTDDDKIHILMQQLKTYRKKIVYPIQFYKKIGFKYEPEWHAKISSHPQLHDASLNGRNISFRLFSELNIKVDAEVQMCQPEIDEFFIKTQEIAMNLMPMSLVLSAVLRDGWRDTIQLKCKNITIDQNGGINTSKFVEIIAETIINNGEIKTRNIKFVCQTFKNFGAIEHARTLIFCEKYHNEGTIFPIPYINYGIKYDHKSIDFSTLDESYFTKQIKDIIKTYEQQFDGVVNQDNFFHFVNSESKVCQYTAEKLVINSKLDVKEGIIQIKCKTLIVGENGVLNVIGKNGWGRGTASGGGGYGSKGKGADTYYYPGGAISAPHAKGSLSGGDVYGEKTLNVLYHGSGSSGADGKSYGGGVVELIAERLINKGSIRCNGRGGGSGGSIKLQAKFIENYGSIESKCETSGSSYDSDAFWGGVGRIAIFYQEKFVNEGSIHPQPFVNDEYIYDSNVAFTSIAD
eukprot:21725_1